MSNILDEIPFNVFNDQEDSLLEGSGVTIGDTFNRQRKKINGVINKLNDLTLAVEAGATDLTYATYIGPTETSNGDCTPFVSSTANIWCDNKGSIRLNGFLNQYSYTHDKFGYPAVSGRFMCGNSATFITQSGTDTDSEFSSTPLIVDFSNDQEQLLVLDSNGAIWCGGLNSDNDARNGYLINAGNENNHRYSARSAADRVIFPAHRSMSSNVAFRKLIHGPLRSRQSTLAIDVLDRLWFSGAIHGGCGLEFYTPTSIAAETGANTTATRFYKQSDSTLLTVGTAPEEGLTNPHIVALKVKEAAYQHNHSDNAQVNGIIRYLTKTEDGVIESPTVGDHNDRASDINDPNDPGGCVNMCGTGTCGILGIESTINSDAWVKVNLEGITGTATDGTDIPSDATIEKLYICHHGSYNFTAFLLLRAAGQTTGYDYIVSWGYNRSGMMGDNSTVNTIYSLPKVVWYSGNSHQVTYTPAAGGSYSYTVPRIKSFGTVTNCNSDGPAYAVVLSTDGTMYFAGNNMSDHAGFKNAPSDRKYISAQTDADHKIWLEAGYQSTKGIGGSWMGANARLDNIESVYLPQQCAACDGVGIVALQNLGTSEDPEKYLWYCGLNSKNLANGTGIPSGGDRVDTEGFVRVALSSALCNKITSVQLNFGTYGDGARNIPGSSSTYTYDWNTAIILLTSDGKIYLNGGFNPMELPITQTGNEGQYNSQNGFRPFPIPQW